MAQRTKDILKTWFETGDKPTEEQFWDLIDSFQQTIVDNEIASTESNDDGSAYFDKLGLIVDIGSGSFDPFNAQSNYEYDIQIDNLWNILQTAIQAPILLKYQANEGVRMISVQQSYNDNSKILHGLVTAQFNGKCCLVTVTVNQDSCHVSFTTGMFGSDFGEPEVRATKMTGVVFNNNSSVTSTDSLIVAVGKLQAQINALKEEPDPEPAVYIAASPLSVQIPSEGTAQEVTVTSNSNWTAQEV